MKDQSIAQSKVLKDYMVGFNKKVDDYKKSIENTRMRMMQNIEDEISILSAQIDEAANKTTEMPDLLNEDEGSTVTLNISKETFQTIMSDISESLLKLNAAYPAEVAVKNSEE